MRSLSWQTVALGAIGTLGFCGLFYMADTTGRTALIMMVSAAGTGVTTVMLNRMRNDMGEVREELTKVKDHVNGNTKMLIDKIPDAQRPDEIPQV